MPAPEAPLQGRRILVTRAAEQLEELVRPLRERGALVTAAPTIRFQAPPDWNGFDRALKRLSGYDLIIFTSQNTLPRMLSRMSHLGIDTTSLGKAELVAIGEATARSLIEKGFSDIRVPDEYRAEGVVELLARGGLAGKRILLPRALVARDELPDGLRQSGAKVDVASVYQTASDPVGLATARMKIESREVDAVTFSSSSTVTHFLSGVGDKNTSHLRQICLASIGPITSETLRRRGLEPTLEANPYTMEALVSALVQHFSSHHEEG